MKLSRRHFLATGATSAVGAVALGTPVMLAERTPLRFSGGIVGANASLGHRLRERRFPTPTETVESEVAIVGGGIAGLAAARKLQRSGVKDFVLLELEQEPGGNSTSGHNAVSAYPWGAHYVPLPGPEAREVIQLFEELGVITGRDRAGLPIYREEFLCADPMERLFIHGRWQEGLVPQFGVADRDCRQIDQFIGRMREWKSARGGDGRAAFCIPVDASSRDSEFLKLDQITMADYLREAGWDSPPLRWYVNYCCRDDYGASLEQVSAWAGIHYFAARTGEAANAAGHAVLTWPEGNGWIVNQMKAPLSANIRGGCAVWNLEPDDRHLAVDFYDTAQERTVRLRANAVVFAGPRFVAQRVIRQWREQAPDFAGLSYSPWMVANLTLNSLPHGDEAALAWDNVLYDSRSLGYVTATHQNLHPFPQKTVVTYYLPLDEAEPRLARAQAQSRTYDDWCQLIIADLSRAHRDIARHITHLDVWLWGHGMIRPTPGFIWGPVRQRMQEPLGNIYFAHSDMSGISIFEEACIRGAQAADQLLERRARASI